MYLCDGALCTYRHALRHGEGECVARDGVVGDGTDARQLHFLHAVEVLTGKHHLIASNEVVVGSGTGDGDRRHGELIGGQCGARVEQQRDGTRLTLGRHGGGDGAIVGRNGELGSDTTGEHQRLYGVQVRTIDLNLLTEVGSCRREAGVGSRDDLQRLLPLEFPAGTVVHGDDTRLGSQGHAQADFATRDVGEVLSQDGSTRHATGKHHLGNVVDIVALDGDLIAGIQTRCGRNRGYLDGLLEGELRNGSDRVVACHEANLSGHRLIGHVDIDVLGVRRVEARALYDGIAGEDDLRHLVHVRTGDANLMGAQDGRRTEAHQVYARLAIGIGVEVVLAAPCQR